MKGLLEQIQTTLAAYQGCWGVVLLHPTAGLQLEINPEQEFPAASMIKVPIMYEIMRQADLGLLSLEESILIPPGSHVGGAGILKELKPNLKLTVQELVTLMIVLSDNTATNLLIERVGMAAVNKTMAALGLNKTVLRRFMMDFAAAQAGEENTTTAKDMALLFTAIYQADGVSEPSARRMVDILSRQQVRDKLPFYLPEEILIANKTGTLDRVEHDGGILFLPKGPYIACVLTAGLAANYLGLQLVAKLGKIIYEYIVSQEES